MKRVSLQEARSVARLETTSQRFEARWKKTALALGALSFVASCTTHSSEEPYRAHESKLPESSCIEFMHRLDTGDRSYASLCAGDLANDRVALVDLRGPEVDSSAEDLAEAITTQMYIDGQEVGFTPTVEAVSASQQLVELHDARPCEKYPQSIVNEAMALQGDSLRQAGYDKLLVATPRSACKSPDGEPESPLGYAEPNRGQALLTAAGDFTQSALVRFAQHELAHLYGLGHSGIVKAEEVKKLISGDGRYLPPDRYIMNNALPVTHVALVDVLKNSVQDGYGDDSQKSEQYSRHSGSIMGTPSHPEEQDADQFSLYHRQMLQQAADTVGNYDADKGKVTRVVTDEIGTYHVRASIGEIALPGYENFTQLIVMPVRRERRGIPENTYVEAEIMLASRQNDTLLIGTIYNKNIIEEGQPLPLEQRYVFTTPSSSVEVRFDQGAISVEVL